MSRIYLKSCALTDATGMTLVLTEGPNVDLPSGKVIPFLPGSERERAKNDPMFWTDAQVEAYWCDTVGVAPQLPITRTRQSAVAPDSVFVPDRLK